MNEFSRFTFHARRFFNFSFSNSIPEKRSRSYFILIFEMMPFHQVVVSFSVILSPFFSSFKNFFFVGVINPSTFILNFLAIFRIVFPVSNFKLFAIEQIV